MFRDHSRHTHFRGEDTSPQESTISARDGKQVSALAAEGTSRNEIPRMSRKYSEQRLVVPTTEQRNGVPFTCHLWSKAEQGVLNTLHEPIL